MEIQFPSIMVSSKLEVTRLKFQKEGIRINSSIRTESAISGTGKSSKPEREGTQNKLME